MAAREGSPLSTGVAALATYLRTLPDDPASWAVYADALTERGDPRGELLALAHDRGIDAPARADLERRQDDWMAIWGELYPDDGACYERWKRLAPLGIGPPTPAELLPILGRPIACVLALLDLDDPSSREVVELHDRQVTAAVVAWIDRAFDGVPAPDEDHRTLYQAEAADNYADRDRSRDFLGRWQDFPDEQLLANQWALAHLDEQGLRYYSPAVMMFALRHPSHEADTWLTESFEYTLQRSSRQLRDYQRQRFSLFDRDQRAALYAYAAFRGHVEAAKAWARVFEAERHVERADWFEIYSRR